MFSKIFLLYFCLTITRRCVDAATVVEVPAGQLAELPCLSIDDNHRFMFWQLINDKDVIGPGNQMDEQKYDYEVLTGKLLIKSASTAEEGFYRCVARGITDSAAINVQIVELIVKKDPALTDNSFETRLLVGMASITVIVVGVAIVLFVLLMKHRQSRGFFDLEESRGNSPARYVRTVAPVPPTSAPKVVEPEGLDNFGMEVDFPKVFQQLQKEETLSM